ncbi:MAG TPA: ATP-binding protein [Actinomycetota bacterium]|nr:ATP-binding protein [Actinomycetota bacterium]
MNRQTSSAGSARDLPTGAPRRAGSRLRPGWVVLLGCAGIGVFAAFLWLVEHTEPPPLPVLVVMVLVVVGLVVGPWAYLAARQLEGEAAAGRILRRVLAVGATLAGTGVAVAAAISISGTGESGTAGAVAMFSILVAGLLSLVGVVVFPWLFLLTRTVTRERAARVRAEERAEVATHLHDSVLQTLTLIQKRTGDPAEMARLARHAERELRGWLYGAADPDRDDLVAAFRAAAAEVEDRFGVSVELVTVGTCRLDERARAVVGAAGEALSTAAKHAGVARVSMFIEVRDGHVVVVVRDRGSGFDQAIAGGRGGRGIPDSILGRMRRQGGAVTIRTSPGAGTEVELRMPVARA